MTETFEVRSGWSGWTYVVTGTTLRQYDEHGRLRETTEHASHQEAREQAVNYATY